jgi:hypothetical protein
MPMATASTTPIAPSVTARLLPPPLPPPERPAARPPLGGSWVVGCWPWYGWPGWPCCGRCGAYCCWYCGTGC